MWAGVDLNGAHMLRLNSRAFAYLDLLTMKSTADLMSLSGVLIAPPFGGIVFLPLIALA